MGHLRPDGDCVGSVLAAGRLLELCGVGEVALAADKRVYPGYAIVPGYARIDERPRPGFDSELTVFVDCGDLKRASEDWRPAGFSINIDHHASNPGFADLNWVAPDRAATCEMLFDLAEAGGLAIDPDLATALLLGLQTDTGSFRYSNTGPRQLEVAAELLRRGADLALVNRAAYESRTRESVALGGAVAAAVRYERDGRLAWSEARLDLLARHGGAANLPENLVSELRSVIGVSVSILFTETEGGGLRASFRADSAVNVSLLAGRFGGGGHPAAAGLTIREGDYEALRDTVLAAARDAIPPGEADDAPRGEAGR